MMKNKIALLYKIFAASLQPLPLHILKTLAAIGRIIGRKNRELAARKNFCGQREALGQ
ncbi:hypothetical protein MTY_2235 [Moorella thermoacetica Y72]|uniref:Uncharacterized protein n=1 Tax=Moorella thermoacetica Y72 TaxID=1325331 RepID=A0A0S6UEG0_NEOTH|nr:hypothetical protein MTY_2235 [Moorella thermoacetica Y72]